MNPMFDFNANEINMIQLALFQVARATQETISHGVEAPDNFVETLESVINKLSSVIEARIKNDDEFESITQSLTDVEQSFGVLVKNPDVEIDEYN